MARPRLGLEPRALAQRSPSAPRFDRRSAGAWLTLTRRFSGGSLTNFLFYTVKKTTSTSGEAAPGRRRRSRCPRSPRRLSSSPRSYQASTKLGVKRTFEAHGRSNGAVTHRVQLCCDSAAAPLCANVSKQPAKGPWLRRFMRPFPSAPGAGQ